MTRRTRAVAFALLASCAAGCSGGGVDATYGRSRDRSLNGTGAFVELLRVAGHEVRTSVRLNDKVADWADTIVRFAPHPGPPDDKEAKWYKEWAAADADRRIIYIPRDFDAESEYWDAVLAHPPSGADDRFLADATTRRNETRTWAGELPKPVPNPALASHWFRVDAKAAAPSVCKKLEGPWAEGVDAGAAGLTRHQSLKPEHDEEVLLRGDGETLAMQWAWREGGSVLVIANGCFLLNEPLARKARRPLAARVVDWLDEGPRQVAVIEGKAAISDRQCLFEGSAFSILCVDPLNWVFVHWFAFLLLAVLSLAAILGRPRLWGMQGDDRPSAHAEALGDLLGKVGDAANARSLVDAYRRWRNPASGSTPARRPPKN